MRSLILALSLLTAAMSMFAPRADAATRKTLYDFCAVANCVDGIGPRGVAMDASGTIYGTTSNGGVGRGAGTVYSLTPNGDGTWTHKVLYSFCTRGKRRCADGQSPSSSLIIDVNGALYGTTYGGGKANSLAGTVFRLSPNADRTVWTLTTLRSFCIENDGCAEGTNPDGSLTYPGQKDGALYDGVSPLYGIAHGGAADLGACDDQGCGLIYKLFPKSETKWKYSVIYRFCQQHGQCLDGRDPNGALAMLNGNTLIGAATLGGAHQNGAVFQLRKAKGQPVWNQTLLYSFCPSDCGGGAFPLGGVTLAGSALWGTTIGGGTKNHGTLFALTPDGMETAPYSFCQANDCPDGSQPTDLLVNGAGDVFGTTRYGGGHDIDATQMGGGVIYRQSGATHTTLYQFCAEASCADGELPLGPLVFGPGGKIYGATAGGGAHSGGTVYELTP